MYAHLVAHALPGGRPLASRIAAWRLWGYLKDGTPEALAACLMPDHLHVIVEAKDPGVVWRSLTARLGAFARREGYERLWAPLPAPREIPDTKHLCRQIRYVHLNPCRAQLVADPLAWPWSTHRAAIGAELEPWVTTQHMASRLGRRPHAFAAWFHGYVSSDPDVAVGGTALPIPALPSSIASVPLAQIVDAAFAVAPLDRQKRVARKVAVLLAYEQGWRDARVLAAALHVTPDSVRRIARQPDARLLSLGRLYLGDARLRSRPEL